jgi:hypothetical protein
MKARENLLLVSEKGILNLIKNPGSHLANLAIQIPLTPFRKGG